MRQRCLRYCATTHFIRRDAHLPTDRKVSKLLGRLKENGGETDDLSAKEKLSVKLEERKITIKDIRGLEKSFDFNKNGFAVVKLDSKMSHEDFNDSKMIRNVYCTEIEARVRQCLGADAFYTSVSRVRSKSNTTLTAEQIRRSHTEFPFTPDALVSTCANDYLGVIAAKANGKAPSYVDWKIF